MYQEETQTTHPYEAEHTKQSSLILICFVRAKYFNVRQGKVDTKWGYSRSQLCFLPRPVPTSPLVSQHRFSVANTHPSCMHHFRVLYGIIPTERVPRQLNMHVLLYNNTMTLYQRPLLNEYDMSGVAKRCDIVAGYPVNK